MAGEGKDDAERGRRKLMIPRIARCWTGQSGKGYGGHGPGACYVAKSWWGYGWVVVHTQRHNDYEDLYPTKNAAVAALRTHRREPGLEQLPGSW